MRWKASARRTALSSAAALPEEAAPSAEAKDTINLCAGQKSRWRMKKMKQYFSIGEAAKAAHMTSETLRHYDRIGLVKPGKKDEWTNYRYYTEQDIVRLNTVRALQCMDLSLQEIKEALELDDLEKVVDFLARAEQKADRKMEALRYSRRRFRRRRRTMRKSCTGGRARRAALSRRSRRASSCFQTRWRSRRWKTSGII